MGKGQVALEFTVLVGFMIMLITGVFVALKSSMTSIQHARERKVLQDVSSFIQNEVRMAQSVHTNYTREFRLPLHLMGSKYSITIQDKVDLVIQYQGRNHVSFLPYPVNGNLNRGWNTVRYREGNISFNKP